jgi:mono/diheme cytochrome c family protein
LAGPRARCFEDEVMRLVFLSCALLLPTWCQNPTLVQQAPSNITAKRNPFEGSQRAREAGAKLFARECSSCHGARAEGSGKAPPLNGPDVGEASDSALFWVLKNGSLHHGMPSFAHLPEPQRWQIITFLRSLYRREK